MYAEQGCELAEKAAKIARDVVTTSQKKCLLQALYLLPLVLIDLIYLKKRVLTKSV
uniref:Uncharacterized protein n=1 Tax=Vibrio tasmaniensis TaxID=212663 RepID=A0A0H3ZSD2_9VIBR|nr:hypothetical protein [Vibrio tasmaniensis]